jgi:hypothetical protein
MYGLVLTLQNSSLRNGEDVLTALRKPATSHKPRASHRVIRRSGDL